MKFRPNQFLIDYDIILINDMFLYKLDKFFPADSYLKT